MGVLLERVVRVVVGCPLVLTRSSSADTRGLTNFKTYFRAIWDTINMWDFVKELIVVLGFFAYSVEKKIKEHTSSDEDKTSAHQFPLSTTV